MYAPTWKLKKFQELYIQMFALAQGLVATEKD